MDPHLLVRCAMLGFAIAAPVGPIGLLCIQRTLSSGRRTGLATGLGAAAADAGYGLLGVLGAGWMLSRAADASRVFHLLGAALIVWLGAKALRTPVPVLASPAPTLSAARAFSSSLLLTLANPLTILSFAALAPGLGLEAATTAPAATAAMMAVFAGSAAWWIVLSSCAAAARTRLRPAAIAWIGRVCGAALIGLGVLQVLQ